MLRREEDQVQCKNCEHYGFVQHPDGSSSSAGYCANKHNSRKYYNVPHFCDKYIDTEYAFVVRIEQKDW